MRYYCTNSIWVGVAVIAFASILLAQTPARPGPAAGGAIPNLAGIYDRPGADREALGGPGGNVNADRRRGAQPRQVFTMEEPPMQPWALEKYKVARQGIPDIYQSGRDDLDPSYNCFPPGPTRVFSDPRPFEIRQFPDQVLMLFESDHWVRRIFMDGRGHPENYPLTWMGHSTGKYEGDTLVVDTVNINDQSWLDSLGHPHSDALHVVERYRRNQNMLEIDFLFDDPKAYTKPWTGKKVYQLMKPSYEIMEHVNCEEYLELPKTR